MTILSSARAAPTSSEAAYRPAFQPYGLRLPRRAPVITDVSPDGALQRAKGFEEQRVKLRKDLFEKPRL